MSSHPTTHDRRARSRRVVGALAAVTAVGAIAAGCSGSSTTPSAAPTSAPTSAGHGKARGIAGTVQAENGGTWTVVNRAGRQFTVTLSPTTAFGTKAAPSSAAAFPVGATVRVQGTVSGTSVTATRISAPAHPAPAAGSPTSTAAPSA